MEEGRGLRNFADKRDRLYGAAVQSSELDDHDFASALEHEANLVVPENELKWDVVHPEVNRYDFSGYQKIARFAERYNMQVRGHCLVWHEANPSWLEPALTNVPIAERILRDHIERVVQETATQVHNWDVVNEAIDPRADRGDFLRDTLWLRALGPDYIPLAYQIAHQARPRLTFVYNDFGLEHDDGAARAKRAGVLKLLERCRNQGTPIDTLGLQSHLQCHRPLGGREFSRFLSDVRGLGLKIAITELDLDVSLLTGSAEDKSKAAQTYVTTYLNLVEDGAELNMLLTWGLSDRYTWLLNNTDKGVGALPLQADLSRAPLWTTLKTVWLQS